MREFKISTCNMSCGIDSVIWEALKFDYKCQIFNAMEKIGVDYYGTDGYFSQTVFFSCNYDNHVSTCCQVDMYLIAMAKDWFEMFMKGEVEAIHFSKDEIIKSTKKYVWG